MGLRKDGGKRWEGGKDFSQPPGAQFFPAMTLVAGRGPVGNKAEHGPDVAFESAVRASDLSKQGDYRAMPRAAT